MKYTLQVIAVLLALAAGGLSYLLLKEHLTGSTGPAWFEKGCHADAEESTRDCEDVLKGDYGVWPPKKPGAPNNVKRVPVAFLGLLYYSFLAVWLIGVGSPSRDRAWLHFFPLGMVATGLAGSVWFTWIMFTVSEAWCLWCLVTHMLNLPLVMCVLLLWPRRRRVVAPAPLVTPVQTDATRAEGETPIAESAAEDQAPAVILPARRHPSARQVVATLLGLVLVLYGHNALLGMERTAAVAKTNYEGLLKVIDRLKGDARKMMARWQREEKREITIRDDDPVDTYQKGEKTLQVVVFSDFQCPGCSAIPKLLEDKVQPLFDHHLRIIFKHYPMNKDCNGNISRTLHKYSCFTSALAEAARVQGGNEAFWEAHDYLFEHRRDLKKILGIDAFAEALDLDAARLRTDMKSEETARRIWEDVNEGKKCELRGTPSVFVSGRHVDSLSVRELEFWDAMADHYWRSLKKPRPEHTKLPE